MNYRQLYTEIQNYSENTEQLFVDTIPTFVQQAEQRIYNSVNLPSLRKSVSGSTTPNNRFLSLPNDWLAVYAIAMYTSDGVAEFLLNKDASYLGAAYPETFPPTTGMPKYYAMWGNNISSPNELTLSLAPVPDQAYQTLLTYFYYPPTIVQGEISSLNTTTFSGGAGYTNGIYLNVSLTGGSGSGAVADIQVSNQEVISVTLKNGGQFYTTGDTLSASTSDLGNGSNFSIPVSAVSNAEGTSWLGDNYSPVLLYGAMREAMLFMKGEQDLVAYYESKYQEALQQLMRLSGGLERGDFYRNGETKYNVNLKGDK